MKTISLLIFLSSTIAACGIAPASKSQVAAAKDGAPGADGKEGAQGASGKDGAPGASGKDGAPGAGMLGVYVGPTLVGYYLGGKEIALTSGALGYFDFTTGEVIGVPKEDSTVLPQATDSFERTCFYAANDCTGACWLDAINGTFQAGYVFQEGKKLWRIDGDERQEENFAFASGRFGNDGSRCSAITGTLTGLALEHEEKIAAGLTFPFGKLTVKKLK